MARMMTIPTTRRRHRGGVRCTLGTVVNVFSNRSVFTRARLLRGGQPLPNPEGTRMPRSEAKRTPEHACASLGRVATYLSAAAPAGGGIGGRWSTEILWSFLRSHGPLASAIPIGGRPRLLIETAGASPADDRTRSGPSLSPFRLLRCDIERKAQARGARQVRAEFRGSRCVPPRRSSVFRTSPSSRNPWRRGNSPPPPDTAHAPTFRWQDRNPRPL